MYRFAVLVFACVVGSVLHGAYSIRHGKNLIWAQVASNRLLVSRLMGIEGDPDVWIHDGRVQVRLISAPSIGWAFHGLAYHYNWQALLWSESMNKRIQSLVLNGSTDTLDLTTGTSGEVAGLAVDWTSGNLYWADSIYAWIAMVALRPPAGGRVYRLLVQQDVDAPHSVAVVPQKGLLLWTDWGARPRVEVGDLVGENRRTLVEKGVRHPRGLAVDAQAGQVYWVDSGTSTVEVVGLDGSGRKILVNKPEDNFFGIALYHDFVFVTEQNKGHLQVYNKTGTRFVDYRLQAVPYDIIMYDEEAQPGNDSACVELGCQHICINDPQTGPYCMCGEGYKSDDLGKTCQLTRSFVFPIHVYAINEAVCQYPVNLADMPLINVTLDTQCFLDNRNGYLALTFDAGNNYLYYSENNTRTISRIVLQSGARAVTVTGGTGEVKGLALDWVADNLFWTDATNGLIKMSKGDGSFPKVVISDHLNSPLGIAVHPGRGTIYWTDDSEDSPRVETASMTGEDRKVISNTGRPAHLYLDMQKDMLYWADLKSSSVMQYDLNTENVTTFFTLPNTTFLGITIYKNYLLWTDTGKKNGIHVANLIKNEKTRGIIHPAYGTAHDLITIDPLNQPAVNSSCAVGQHQCEQLCVMDASGQPFCACGLGFQLDEDRVSCVARAERDNFLLVTDAYQRAVYQISAEDSRVHAVKMADKHQPIAVGYEPVRERVYWSDNTARVIKSTNLDGNDERIVIALSNNSVCDGLAVDHVHGLLYYTDTGPDVIAVVSLVNPALHRTLVRTGLDEPRAIVVLPTEGTMYWTDWGRQAKIETARMDGSERSTLVNLEGVAWPNGLAVDVRERKLYWTEAHNNKIEVISLEGHGRRMLLQEDVSHYFGITVLGDFLYITDWKKQFLQRMHKHGGVLQQFGPASFAKLYGIHAHNASQLTRGYNKCPDMGCQHLCVPVSASNLSCLCMDGYVLQDDGKGCAPEPSTTTAWVTASSPSSFTENSPTSPSGVTSSASLTTSTSSTSSSSTSATVTSENSTPTPSSSMTTISMKSPPSTETSPSPTESPTDVTVAASTTKPEMPNRGIGSKGAAAIAIVLVLVIIAAVLISVYLWRRYRIYRIPHDKLVEDTGGRDPFYQQLPNSERQETAFDSGIENPGYQSDDLPFVRPESLSRL